jgi:Tol biopolymer transport system component
MLLCGMMLWPASTVAQEPHPYSVSRPLTEPVLFAEGVVSTPDYELNSAFMPDGRTVYFTKSTANMAFWTIVVTRFRDGAWTEPEVAPFSGQYSDADPFVSPDGNRLFFISRRPVPGFTRREPHIWYVERSGTTWSEPRNIAVLNGEAGEYYPSVAADGTLYFATARPGGLGHRDLYRSRLAGGAYQEPENLGAPLNGPFYEGDSVVAPDQSFIIVTITGRPDDMGAGDLYIIERKDGVWTAPRHLGPKVNSNALEFCPILSPDGKYLFFSSNRGFTQQPPQRPHTYSDLIGKLRGVRNGLGNVYQIDLAAVR